MELWVRGQDKNNLKKVNNIYVEHITKDYDSWVGNIHCRPYVITSDNGNLGFYATKERALEVLDEIQDILKPIIITTNYECEIKDDALDKTHFNLEMNPQNTEIQEFSTYVYQMPEE